MATNGTSGRDILRGGFLSDAINGLGGDDDLFGEGGNDTLSGGEGSDFLKGGEGNDRLFGGADNDVLISGERDPSGGSARLPPDPALTQGGFDLLSGGSGDDRLIATLDSSVVTAEGGTGNDTVQIGFDEQAIADFINAFPSMFQTDPSLFKAEIDLAAGTGAYKFNGSLIDLLLNISEVENVRGSAFSETINGNGAANLIEGRGGNDTIGGGEGADTIDGGTGRDRANYDGFFSVGVTVDLNLTTQIGRADEKGDRLISIEDLGGSSQADTLRGNSVANALFGNDGDDLLEGRGGADTLTGGGGIDTASYASSSARVIVQLEETSIKQASIAREGDAEGDRLFGIENLAGSGFGDNLTGNSGANLLSGSNGNDALAGLEGNDTLDGGFGNDLLDGGGGIDTATYAGAAAAVQVTLRDGRDGEVREGPFFTDTLRGIERVTGSRFDDAFFGNSADNVFRGGEGNDFFTGSRGNDTLDGDEGLDTLDLTAETGGVRVVLSSFDGGGSLTYAGSSERDSLSSIERVVGTNFADTFVSSFSGLGEVRNDIFFGKAGDDIYFVNDAGILVNERANEGFDEVKAAVSYTLQAGQAVELLTAQFERTFSPINLTGNDLDNVIKGNLDGNILTGAGGNDVLEGGAGDDTLAGGEGNDFLNGGLPVFGAGPEFDTADYRTSLVGVTVNLGFSGAQNTGQGLDTLFSIENVIGSAFNDLFLGSSANNTFDGRDGIDTIAYVNAVGPVTVDLGLGVASGGDIGFDTLISIENAAGSGAADALTGSAAANRLEGLTGADTLKGLGGDDVLLGGSENDLYDFTGAASLGDDLFFDASGFDTVRFDFRNLGSVVRDGNDLVANFTNGDSFRVQGHFIGNAIEQAQDSFTGNVVTLAVGLTGGDAPGIIAGTKRGETLDGRGGDDFLYGGGGRDTLLGGAGNDLLDGGRGGDVLVGGGGRDKLFGGGGNDVFVFAPGSGRDEILDFGRGHDRIDLRAFHTSFRALDTDHDNRLENGEGNRIIQVKIQDGDTVLSFNGGSVVVDDVVNLRADDFFF